MIAYIDELWDALRAESDTTGRVQPMPSEGRQSRRYDTPTSLRTRRPDQGTSVRASRTAGASATPQHPPEAHDLSTRLRAGGGSEEQQRSCRYFRTFPTGSSGRRRRLRGRSTSKGLRAGTDPLDGYAVVHRGKRTTRPQTFRARADESVRCSEFWATRRSTDRARAG
jgi:hypothetical protein